MGYPPEQRGQFAGAGGNPHPTNLEAYLSHYSPYGQYSWNNRVFSSEQAMMRAKWEAGIVDWSKWPG